MWKLEVWRVSVVSERFSPFEFLSSLSEKNSSDREEIRRNIVKIWNVLEHVK